MEHFAYGPPPSSGNQNTLLTLIQAKTRMTHAAGMPTANPRSV
jgi:hypothetical protein